MFQTISRKGKMAGKKLCGVDARSLGLTVGLTGCGVVFKLVVLLITTIYAPKNATMLSLMP